MITLLVMTDGRRDCITEAVRSAKAHLHGPITRAVIHDDSGDPDYRGWLIDTFPGYEVLGDAERSGFGGAIRAAWSHVRGYGRFVFHLEDDFTFNRHVDLPAMADVLDRHPHLAQLALRRQPWNDAERAAGGIVEQHPEAYVDMRDAGDRWLEHWLFFTTNPSLYRTSLCDTDWPNGECSEGRFTHQLLASGVPVSFGFWGARDSGEWVTHIGHTRAGTGY